MNTTQHLNDYKIMSNFYLSDPNVLINGSLTPLQYRIYSYCCSQFNVKKMTSFIRIVNIGGQFQKTKEEVEEILISLNKIKVHDRELISIKEGPEYILFDMPAHRYFLEQVGFKKFKTYKGWRALNGYLKQINQVEKDYLYKDLDQYQLQEQLESLPIEKLNKINSKDLRYPWILKSVKSIK